MLAISNQELDTAGPSVSAVAPRVVGPITRTDIVRFAGAGGDFNPVHHDEVFARKAGYPSVFAMGMLTAGLLGDYVATWLNVVKVRRLAVRFASPVWPGDVLSLSAAEISVQDARTVARLVVSAGEQVRVTGEAWSGGALSAVGAEIPPTPEDLRHLLRTAPAEVTLPVERGKVMEFARATKSENPLHFDLEATSAAGFRDLIAPLTFSAVAAHYNGGDAADVPEALGFDISRVLHGEERWSYARPVVAGETLTGVRTVAAAWHKLLRSGGTMTFVLLPTEYRDAAGELVLRDEQLMIEMPPRGAGDS